VICSAGIGDAVDELLGAAHRAGATASNFAGSPDLTSNLITCLLTLPPRHSS
jgi:hypothetical protein